jgi:hypothetical protein
MVKPYGIWKKKVYTAPLELSCQDQDNQVRHGKFLMDGRVVRCRRTDDGRYCIAVAFNTSNELLKARMMEQVVRIKAFKDRLEKRYHVSLDFAEVAKEWIKRYSEYFADRYNFDE